jgi:DNA-binding NarL/FixJ family response regulator
MLARTPRGWDNTTIMTSSARKEARPPGRKDEHIRVLIADDHRTFAEALRVVLRTEKGLSVVAVVHDGRSAVDESVGRHPDVVLMDVEMPQVDGISAARAIKERDGAVRVVMLSAHQDDHVVARAIDAGATGFLYKDSPLKDVARSIRAAYRGEPLIEPQEMRRVLRHLRRRRDQDAASRARVDRLTKRETEILQMMADGSSSEKIAKELNISRNTLRTHVQNVLFKLKVHSKLEALATAIRFGKVITGDPVEGPSPLSPAADGAGR